MWYVKKNIGHQAFSQGTGCDKMTLLIDIQEKTSLSDFIAEMIEL